MNESVLDGMKRLWFYPIEELNFIIIEYLQLTWEEFITGSEKREICAVNNKAADDNLTT